MRKTRTGTGKRNADPGSFRLSRVSFAVHRAEFVPRPAGARGKLGAPIQPSGTKAVLKKTRKAGFYRRAQREQRTGQAHSVTSVNSCSKTWVYGLARNKRIGTSSWDRFKPISYGVVLACRCGGIVVLHARCDRTLLRVADPRSVTLSNMLSCYPGRNTVPHTARRFTKFCFNPAGCHAELPRLNHEPL